MTQIIAGWCQKSQRRASDICPDSKSSEWWLCQDLWLKRWLSHWRHDDGSAEMAMCRNLWSQQWSELFGRRLLSFYPRVQNCYFRRFSIVCHLSSSFGAMDPSHVIDDADVDNRQSWSFETKETIETTKPITVIWCYKLCSFVIQSCIFGDQNYFGINCCE